VGKEKVKQASNETFRAVFALTLINISTTSGGADADLLQMARCHRHWADRAQLSTL